MMKLAVQSMRLYLFFCHNTQVVGCNFTKFIYKIKKSAKISVSGTSISASDGAVFSDVTVDVDASNTIYNGTTTGIQQ